MSIAYALKWKSIEFRTLNPTMKAEALDTMTNDLICTDDFGTGFLVGKIVGKAITGGRSGKPQRK